MINIIRKAFDSGIILFDTAEAYGPFDGVGSGFQAIRELCPGSRVLEGFEMKAGAEKDGQFLVIRGEKATEAETKVSKWLQKIKIMKKGTIQVGNSNE